MTSAVGPRGRDVAPGRVVIPRAAALGPHEHPHERNHEPDGADNHQDHTDRLEVEAAD